MQKFSTFNLEQSEINLYQKNFRIIHRPPPKEALNEEKKKNCNKFSQETNRMKKEKERETRERWLTIYRERSLRNAYKETVARTHL